MFAGLSDSNKEPRLAMGIPFSLFFLFIFLVSFLFFFFGFCSGGSALVFFSANRCKEAQEEVMMTACSYEED